MPPAAHPNNWPSTPAAYCHPRAPQPHLAPPSRLDPAPCVQAEVEQLKKVAETKQRGEETPLQQVARLTAVSLISGADEERAVRLPHGLEHDQRQHDRLGTPAAGQLALVSKEQLQRVVEPQLKKALAKLKASNPNLEAAVSASKSTGTLDAALLPGLEDIRRAAVTALQEGIATAVATLNVIRVSYTQSATVPQGGKAKKKVGSRQSALKKKALELWARWCAWQRGNFLALGSIVEKEASDDDILAGKFPWAVGALDETHN